jgi:hypothetical protein
MNDKLELDSCPFGCNPGPDNEELGMTSERFALHRVYQVECSCGARGPHKDTPQDAAAAWNDLPLRLVDSLEYCDKKLAQQKGELKRIVADYCEHADDFYVINGEERDHERFIKLKIAFGIPWEEEE